MIYRRQSRYRSVSILVFMDVTKPWSSVYQDLQIYLIIILKPQIQMSTTMIYPISPCKNGIHINMLLWVMTVYSYLMGVDAIDETICPEVLGMTKCSIAWGQRPNAIEHLVIHSTEIFGVFEILNLNLKKKIF